VTIHWPGPPRSKYSAKRQVLDGQRFASRHEAARYAELQLLARAGFIRGLTCQPSYELRACVIGPRGRCQESRVIAIYRADFAYEERRRDTWHPVIEDAKGVRTPIYRLKKKWFEAQYGAVIREV
jgi:hypothetical protein